MALPSTWEEPVSLSEASRVPWPAAAFDGVLADMVAEVARFTQTPPDFPGMMLLAALSVAWAGKVCVEVHRGYREPLMLYVLVIAQSGERKSAVSDLIAGPLVTAVGPLGAELLVDDATPEAIEELMGQTGGKVAVFGGEGGAFLDNLGARQRGLGSALYLKGYTGEPHISRRVGRGAVRIARPVLSIGLMTQPSVLRGLLAREELLHRGFLGRILYSCPAAPRAGTMRPRVAPVSEAVLAAYEEHMAAALAVPLPEQVPALVLSVEAQAEYDRFFLAIEERRQPGGDLARLAEWAPKLRGNVMRVAGLMHLCSHGGGAAALQRPIGADAVRRAVLLSEYFISHAQSVFLLMGEDRSVAQARRLLGWLRHGRRERFTAREAHRYLARLGTREVVLNPVLRVLLANGYIRGGRVVKRGADGLRHTESYQVNPIEVRRWQDAGEDAGEDAGGVSFGYPSQ